MKPRHILYAVLATLVIFAAGVVTGGLLVRSVLPQKTAPPPGSGWQMARLDQFQRAVIQLDLTPEQRRKVIDIARERQEYIADMMRILEPDLPGLFTRMRHDIDQVLTPDQRVELERRWAQVQRKKFEGRAGEMNSGDLPPLQPGQPLPADGRRQLGPDGQPPPFRPNGQRPGRQFQDRQPGGERPAPGNPPSPSQ